MKQAIETHEFFCTCNSGKCKGIRSFEELPDEKYIIDNEDCIYANEFNSALTDIIYGVRVIDDIDNIQDFDHPNFFENDEEREVAYNDLIKESKRGWVKILSHMPKYITSMFCKKEDDKTRVIKNYSGPKGRAINDNINDIKTTLMSVRSARVSDSRAQQG